jgi:hypothetical protein
MSIRQQHGFAHVAICWAYAQIVRLWPADSRHWALAMQAELSEINNPKESLSWLAGGVMSLSKAWWNQAVYGWNKNESEPSVITTPGPIALSLAIVALAAFFMWPSAHVGFSAVLQSWPPYNGTSFRARIQEMTRKAEADHDAKTIAFCSRYADYRDESPRLVDEAVAMDPSLTWLYVRGYSKIARERGWAEKLQAWDPDNATPYLVEAGNRDSEIQSQANYEAPKQRILNDPEWRAAMEKAFAAPRYDYYSDRLVDLQRSVLNRQNINDPGMIGLTLYQMYPAGLFESRAYSRYLLEQANQALQKGDRATASRLAWTVAHFAERVRANAHGDLVRNAAEGMLQPAYEFLQPLEATAGNAEVAKLLAIENEALAGKKTPHNSAPLPLNPYRHFDATSVALHAGALGVALFGGLLVLSLSWLVLGRFVSGLRSGRMYCWACNCARFAPASLAGSIALLAFTFSPYLETIQSYFAGASDPATLEKLASMNITLYSLPEQFTMPLSFDHQGIFFGEAYVFIGLITLATITVALFLYRSIFHSQESHQRAA